MALAILAVLILIAVLIAPWLLWVIAAAAALYGVWLVALGVVAALAVIVAFPIGLVRAWEASEERRDTPEEIVGARKACESCQVEMAVADTECRSCGHLNP